MYLAGTKNKVMSRFFKVVLLLTIGILVFSCNKDDDSNGPSPEKYADQYAKDIARIDEFIDNHYMKVDPVTFDVTYTKIMTPGPDSLSIREQTQYPLQFKMVEQEDHEVNYKVYFINFRQGIKDKPCRVDSALVSYRGEYLYKKKEAVKPATNPVTYIEYITGKEFEEAQTPVWFRLAEVVQAWQEIIPLFQTGTSSFDPVTGVIDYQDFGAGVFFIPSGLGYFSSTSIGGQAYSPLVFSFKLKHLNRIDHDVDGIDSYLEDLNENGIFSDDDTDDDGRPNYLDSDDDGDGFITKAETSYVNPSDPGAVKRYYPYNGAAVDDPGTPYVDETKGVPNCAGDYTTPTRLRKYLDKTCH